nr:metallophosphoesterase [uncultured Sellimonas sp.]
MIAVFLAPLYLFVNIYILRWLLRWMEACHHHFKKRWVRVTVIAVYMFVAFSLVLAFFCPPGKLQRVLKYLSNYWLGTMIYIVLVVIIVDIIRIILKHSKKVDQKKLASRRTFVTNGTFCIVLILVITLSGVFNAHNIRTTDYKVSINKTAGNLDSLNIILVADLHLGYSIGTAQMKKMVKKINAQNPDLVVIAGDIFDNEYEALDDPDRLAKILSGIDSTYGTYACYGNHDIQEPILAGFTFNQKGKKVSDPRMDKFLKDADIRLLRDESVLIDKSFYLYGRPDYERPGRGITKRKTPKEFTADLNKDLPIIVIDHEPRELQELADAGVDLDLCGHTHDGQLFPGNIITKFFWENSCGYLKKDNMHNIVTSGIGVFGPNIRVGTRSEICNVHVTFQ